MGWSLTYPVVPASLHSEILGTLVADSKGGGGGANAPTGSQFFSSTKAYSSLRAFAGLIHCLTPHFKIYILGSAIGVRHMRTVLKTSECMRDMT